MANIHESGTPSWFCPHERMYVLKHERTFTALAYRSSWTQILWLWLVMATGKCHCSVACNMLIYQLLLLHMGCASSTTKNGPWKSLLSMAQFSLLQFHHLNDFIIFLDCWHFLKRARAITLYHHHHCYFSSSYLQWTVMASSGPNEAAIIAWKLQK